jgi:hypothetical protein
MQRWAFYATGIVVLFGLSETAAAQPQPIPVELTNLALPPGAATDTNQATGNTNLAEIEGATETLEQAYDAVSDSVKVLIVEGSAGAAIDFDPSTAYSVVSATAMLAANIKASAGTVDGWSCTSVASGIVYARLVNKASAPDPSADASALILSRALLFANTGGIRQTYPGGLSFSTGIGIAVTEVSLATDTDESTLTAGEVTCNVEYR